jgi:hypothetical protein
LRLAGLVVTYDWWKFQAVFLTVKECEKIPRNPARVVLVVIYDWWKFQAVFLPVKVCEKIPTLGTQLRVLSTVKANPICVWLV